MTIEYLKEGGGIRRDFSNNGIEQFESLLAL